MSVWFRSRLSVCMYVCMCVEYVYTMSSRWSRGGVRGHFEGTGRCNKLNSFYYKPINIAVHNGVISAHVHVAPDAGM